MTVRFAQGRSPQTPTKTEPDRRRPVPSQPAWAGHCRRSEPLLIRQWTYLWRRELVELRRGNTVMDTGAVDESTADGSTIWIHLTGGRGRVLIHRDDGIDIWRIDSRILQDRGPLEAASPSRSSQELPPRAAL